MAEDRVLGSEATATTGEAAEGFFRKLLGDALGWRREAAERALKSFYALHFCTTPVWSWTVS